MVRTSYDDDEDSSDEENIEFGDEVGKKIASDKMTGRINQSLELYIF